MHKSNVRAYLDINHFLLDPLLILSSFILAYTVTSHLRSIASIFDYIWILVIFIPLWVLTMHSLKMYDLTTFQYYDRIIRYIAASTVLSSLLLAAAIFYLGSVVYDRLLYSLFVGIVFIVIATERTIHLFYAKKHNNVFTKKVIVVGAFGLIKQFEYYLKKTDIAINIIGYLHMNDKKPLYDHNYLGGIDDLETILKKYVIDEVIFVIPKKYVREIEKYVLLCEEMGTTSSMVLGLFDLNFSKTLISSMGTLPMLTFHSVCLNRSQMFIKRSVDILGSLIGLIITSIVSIILIPAIKLDSPGPVFFAQDRMGINGRKFKLFKFRTMYVDAESRKQELMAQNEINSDLMFKIKDDPRITKIGKLLRATSLDELPQFINVLRGEMSLVGTRPPTLDEVSKYDNHHYRRLRIKPGITGMWQVNGRNHITDFNKVVSLDTKYIDNWSLFLDLQIIFKTILVVFKKEGAY